MKKLEVSIFIMNLFQVILTFFRWSLTTRNKFIMELKFFHHIYIYIYIERERERERVKCTCI